METKDHAEAWLKILDEISRNVDSSQNRFDKTKHDSESRLEITKLFLNSYFFLIGASFIFTAIYNGGSALINHFVGDSIAIPYLDVSNTVSLITTTLSSGVGFVIGYYFKNKGEN